MEVAGSWTCWSATRCRGSVERIMTTVGTARAATVAETVANSLTARNPVSHAFFDREAPRLALAAREMAERFARGGRLLAIGALQQSTDAQHVAVEFVHPVIVGKRALAALDLSSAPRAWTAGLVRPDDMVMAFASASGDPASAEVIASARAAGAMTFALPGAGADYACDAPDGDPFISQEIVEILYHTVWETV